MDKISLLDIQDLRITKKHVRIESSKYEQDAYEKILSLVDDSGAILFDKDTNRIYTLGQYYGGDTFKENLFYFSKLLNINNNEITEVIDSLKNEDSISLSGEDGIIISFKENNTINIKINKSDLIEENSKVIKLDDERKFNLSINENNKIDLNEYVNPQIYLTYELIKYNITLNSQRIEIPFEFNSDWSTDKLDVFNITIEKGILSRVDLPNKKIILTTLNNYISPTINIEYGINGNIKNESFTIYWEIKCYYGIYRNNNFIEHNTFNIEDFKFNNNLISLNQRKDEHAYLLCPKICFPMFINTKFNIQGAWHKMFNNTRYMNGLEYVYYITDNDNLGKMDWEVLNK